jgi:hypothetical protein
MKTFRLFCIALISAILIQLVTPHVAFADDAAPPPPSEAEVLPTEPSQPAEDQPVEIQPAEITPAESEQSIEVLSANATLSETEQPVDAVITEEAPSENLLDTLPENTDIVVLDANNDPVPLATEAAVTAIAESDPAWCPEGASLATHTCANYATFSSLLAGLHSLGALTNGTVYVQAGLYGGTETSVTFDGNYLPNVGNLTLIGGWDLTLPDPVQTGDTTLGVPLSFINWTHDLEIQDINIDHANGTGLTIQTTKPVSLINVNATNNQGDGINIRANANVTLNNVHATDNTGDGLVVTTLKRFYDCSVGGEFYPDTTYVSSDGYTYSSTPGLHMGRRCFLSPYTITLRNSGFNDNDGNGITITTGESITLDSVTANGNGGDGAFIYQFYNKIPAFPWSYYQNLSYSELLNSLRYDMQSDQVLYYKSLNPPEPYLYDLYAEDQLDKIISSDLGSTFSGNGGVDFNPQYEPNPYFDPDPYFGDMVFLWCGFECVLPPVSIPILGGEQIDTGGDPNPENPPSGGSETTPNIGGGKSKANSGGGGGTSLCAQNSINILQLPSGDSLTVYCPISGTLSVKELGRKGLPASLPDGLTFIAGLNVSLSQDGTPTQIITDAGHLKPSFVVPAGQTGTPVILYWDADAKAWVELPAFGSEGSVTLSNGRMVLEGIQFLANTGLIEVGVNFPGIFVLAVK